MMTALKYTAIASAFLLTAGSAAFAQNYNQNPSQGTEYNQGPQSYNPESSNQSYNTNPGTESQGFTGYGSQAYNQGTSSQGYNPGMQSYNPGMQNYQHPGTQGYNPGMQGSTWSGNQQFNSAAGYGNTMGMNQQQVVQELRRYGYENLQDLRPMQGWSADAMRNGERVHIILGDNGEVATFQGRR